MLFNSFEFIIFLPIVFLLYWYASRNLKYQNFLILLASYVFYGWWDWRFLLLIAITSLCSFSCGILLENYNGHRKKQIIVSAVNIIINLTILGIFKYYNFFVENLDIFMFHILNRHLDWLTLDVILPVGISFYTFQALSYTIDIYNKKINATRDIIGFFAYISFFPQLVAGPIERATNLLPQILNERHFNYAVAVDGCRQMLWGFFKKLVVADNCAMIVNLYWNDYQNYPGIALLALGILFTFQIYCDFSGYSDIAIGCSRLFGINLMRNFNFPYFSLSIPEFWRRWHISLMTWFRDYVYFPLGGNRCAKWKVIRNTIIVFGISGLWHGANWTFVCWGLYHASLIAIYILIGINTKIQIEQKKLLPSLKETGLILTTFFLVVIGWIIFRAESMSQAVEFLTCMVTNPFIGEEFFARYITYGLAVMAIEWLQRNKQHALQLPNNRLFNQRWERWLLYYALILIISRNLTHQEVFIYFQF